MSPARREREQNSCRGFECAFTEVGMTDFFPRFTGAVGLKGQEFALRTAIDSVTARTHRTKRRVSVAKLDRRLGVHGLLSEDWPGIEDQHRG